MDAYHKSVLKKEAVDFLHIKKGSIYIDATIGGGGHSEEIIKRGGKVLAIDRDEEAIERLKQKNLKNITLVCSNFSNIKNIANENGITKVAGIIFDLGVSSHQIDEAKRGFSFKKEGPLDMRMDKRIQVTAHDLVNNLERRRLYEIIQDFGQEKLSWPITDAICNARQIKPFKTTYELANIIREVYRRKKVKNKIDSATKTFQALRIVVNSELLNLKEALPQTVDLLEKNGRLVVISFHSLEDAQVKRFLKETKSLKALIPLPIGPSNQEQLENPRSRSAKMRVAEKI